MEDDSVDYALLGVQRALLDAVTPTLRAVVVDMEGTSRFYLRFYYDGEASEELIDLWDCIGCESSADLGPCEFDQEIERLDYPQEIPLRGCYAYLRDESEMPLKKKASESVHYDTKKIAGETIPIAYAMLAVQNALLGVVTPELRGVIVDVENENHLFYLHFYYHGEVSQERINIWWAAIKKAHEDLGVDYALDAGADRCDWPERYPRRGRYAYSRKEEAPQG